MTAHIGAALTRLLGRRHHDDPWGHRPPTDRQRTILADRSIPCPATFDEAWQIIATIAAKEQWPAR